MIDFQSGQTTAKLSQPVDLDSLADIERRLASITVLEIKSSRKKTTREGFAGFFSPIQETGPHQASRLRIATARIASAI
jgi:hypothetical protein